MTTGIQPCTVDEQLIRAAIMRAGGQVHTIVGLVAMYRSAVQDSPKKAQLLERKLRQFVAGRRIGC